MADELMPPMDDLTLVAPMAQISLDDAVRTQVKRWLESTATTQTALAAQIGRNEPWMSRYLSGEFNADLDTLKKIAEAFDHTLAALFQAPQDPDVARLVAFYLDARLEDRKMLLQVAERFARPARARRKVRRRG